MARPTFIPIFEETESVIKNRMLERVGEDWRKEPGDFMFDAVVPSALEVQTLQIQNDYILKNGFAAYAEGEYLDLKLAEVGLTRIPATPNKRALQVTADAGITIPEGHTAISVVTDDNGNSYEFTVDTAVTFTVSGTQTVNLTCKTTGAATNVPNGTSFILQPSIPGIRLIVDTGTTTPGADQESDAAAWERYDFKVRNPQTGGNKNDYVTWALERTGVGKAKCVPRWDGYGTVKVVLLGTDYAPASDAVVADVQAYIDPESKGLGEGKAPCGATVTVVKATGVPVNISAVITWAEGADQAAGKTAFEAAVTEYLKSLAFTESPNVLYNKIGALLSFTNGVSNYSNLTVNGGTVDIAVPTEAVATLGTVTFT